MIRHRLWAASLLLGAFAAPASADEWVQLFNGKDLDGWVAYDGKGQQDTASRDKNWKVEDGVIHGSGPVSHLYTPRTDYKNFKYRVEAKIADKANSGQYFRTTPAPGFPPKGYEAQINSSHTDPVRTGSLYNHVKVFDQLVKPDTWFTQEVDADGDHIVIKVNGKVTVDTHDAKFAEGAFAFQQHDPGSQVWIRKVEVMELPSK